MRLVTRRTVPAARIVLVGTVLLALSSTLAAAHLAADAPANSSAEDRGFMDKAANAELITGGLNTLTTSCNGACGANAPCVIVGTASAPASRINCVNDTRCATLTTGRTALCMMPFAAGAATWGFYPAQTNDTAGLAPFERVGLVQPSDGVDHVLFRRADGRFGPLPTALDVSSLNLVPAASTASVAKLTFDTLALSGLENALTVTSVAEIEITNCNLTTIPARFVLGNTVRKLDLSRNAITSAREIESAIFPALEELSLQDNKLTSMELTGATFPALRALQLDGNQLAHVPAFVFELGTLTNLSVARNAPLNASALNVTQLAFLAQLASFAIDGVTESRVCPPVEIVRRLNASFTFCVGKNESGSGSGSGDTNVGDDITTPAPTPPVSVVTPPANTGSSSSKAGLIVGIVIGVLALLAIVAFVYRWCVRRRERLRDTEPHKPTFTSIGSFIAGPAGVGVSKHHHSMVDDFIGGGADGAGGHYDAFMPLRSNASSEQSSDSYPILGNIAADGPDGLPRLSYQDLYLHKLLRVSSRSELWLGEFLDEDVLVKKMKANTVSRAVMRDFVEEVKLISVLQHPRIVAFRGALWDKSGTELCAVVEYMEKGPLRAVTTAASTTTLSVPKRHAIARQIAEALAFLHDQQIVHGRLNTFNVLLDAELSAKLSVFAIFHYVRLSPLDYECAVFVAPEVQRGQQPTEKADVYAFGVVLVELDAGESPETNRRRRLSLQDSGPDAGSPTAARTGFKLSAQCSSMMKHLIAACLERDPARRPSMAQIAMALRTGEMVM